MSHTLTLIAIVAGAAAIGQPPETIQDGDWIIVRAAIIGCPDFPGVLKVDRATVEGGFVLPGLAEISIVGLNTDQARERIRDRIGEHALSGNRPRSIRVQILGSDAEITRAQEAEQASREYLRNSDCLETRPRYEIAPPPHDVKMKTAQVLYPSGADKQAVDL